MNFERMFNTLPGLRKKSNQEKYPENYKAKERALKSLEDMNEKAEVVVEEVSDEIYERFVESGEISEGVIDNIVVKIKNNEELSDRETAIFTNKTSEINERLKEEKDAEEGEKMKKYLKSQ